MSARQRILSIEVPSWRLTINNSSIHPLVAMDMLGNSHNLTFEATTFMQMKTPSSGLQVYKFTRFECPFHGKGAVPFES